MRESMKIYPRTAAERAMKLQEVLLRATAGKIKWWQAAELMGVSARQMRRWRKRPFLLSSFTSAEPFQIDRKPAPDGLTLLLIQEFADQEGCRSRDLDDV